ncbi:hypothetical protein BK816_04855 [Boudabousia tangfeifanii]|uniref:Oxidoreductase n=1 Tax=Boudabousia tangfeifanii TaxID=1912795 RepID=A0A1D9MKJ7_9ACTO|nr:Gfo/Idh/MocA family oxidoreductase [Boudabousia tangfeifanii]AOZ72703.1 hypothetical protein BK816_04855 [Boudabousia tangfeifanii]
MTRKTIPTEQEQIQEFNWFGKDRELKVGVIGCGARAHLALNAEKVDPNAHLVAVCEPHRLAEKRIQTRLKRQAIDHPLSDIELTATKSDDAAPIYHCETLPELIASGIDVAFVLSPDDTHAEITCELLQQKIPVYLEKPLAITMEGANAVLTTAYETKTPLYVGHNMRHMQVVRQMREEIRKGTIGEVKAVWCRHFVGAGGDFYFKDWHAQREHVNSLLLQKAAHDIDVIHWLTGQHSTEVVAMGGQTLYHQVKDRARHEDELMWDWYSNDNWPPLNQTGLNPQMDVEDLSMMLMKLTGGVFASYQQCHYTPDYWRNYTVIGTEGRMENFGDTQGGVIKIWRHRMGYQAEGDLEIPIVGDEGGHSDADLLTVKEFLEFVRTGKACDTNPVSAWHAVAAGIGATNSIRHGSTPQTWDQLPAAYLTYFDKYTNQ